MPYSSFWGFDSFDFGVQNPGMKFVGKYSAMMWPCVLCCCHYSFSLLSEQVGCGRAGFRFGEWKLGD